MTHRRHARNYWFVCVVGSVTFCREMRSGLMTVTSALGTRFSCPPSNTSMSYSSVSSKNCLQSIRILTVPLFHTASENLLKKRNVMDRQMVKGMKHLLSEHCERVHHEEREQPHTHIPHTTTTTTTKAEEELDDKSVQYAMRRPGQRQRNMIVV